MPALARTVGLLVGCLSLVLACSQPRPGPVEAEADALAEEDLPDQVDDGSPPVDAAGDQADSATGSGDADTLDTAPPACTLADCDDGWACTLDTCKAGVCTHLPLDATPCDDGDPCTTGEKCFQGSCGGASDANCDDGNGCTADSCEPGKGCVHKPGPGTCSDGDACTTGETCTDGACGGSTAKFCGDNNFCTDDSCDSAKGCVFSYNSAPCDSDSNVCTVDKCAGGTCAYLPVPGTTTACDDGSPCTQEDHCEKGKCVGAAVVWTVDYPSENLAPGFGAKQDVGVAFGTQNKTHGIDWGGHELWSAPVGAGELAATSMGWTILGDVFYFVDTTGKPAGSVKVAALGPQTAISGSVGVDANIIAAAFTSPNPWEIILISPDGGVAQSWPVPKWYVPEGRILQRKSGEYLWAMHGPPTWALQVFPFSLANGVAPVPIGPSLEPLPYPYQSHAGQMYLAEAKDASLYIAVVRLTQPAVGTVAVHLWHTTSTGNLLWYITLPLSGQPPESDQGNVAVAAVGDDTVEVWAGAGTTNTWIYNQGYASWRLRADGTMIWQRDEDQRRRVGSALVPKGLGVVGPNSYVDAGTGNTRPARLTRSDAFGNITCAESGPCWDKPATYCDDGDSCTNDLCGAQWNGCHHEPFADGMPCKPGKTCQKGKCGP